MFVRYEVVFQLAWVAGAFVPALLPIDFRLGILILAALYVRHGRRVHVAHADGASALGIRPRRRTDRRIA